MTRRIRGLAILTALVLGAGIFLFDTIRADRLVEGVIIVIGLSTLAATLFWHRGDHGELADTRGWMTHTVRAASGLTDERGYARVSAAVTSYLHSRNRGDELHPFVLRIARDRLKERGIVLGVDPAADRAALGEELHAYLVAPDATPGHRTAEQLERLVRDLEALS